jgi:hypothetical protein
MKNILEFIRGLIREDNNVAIDMVKPIINQRF